MSVLKKILCHNLLIFLCIPTVFPTSSSAEEQQIELISQLAAEQYYLGEPVYLRVCLRWKNPEPGVALVTAQSFLELEVRNDSGEALATPQSWVELSYETDDGNGWLDRPIVLTSNAPEWRGELLLNRRYSLSSPGSYSVLVSWRAPPLPEGETSEQLKTKVPQTHSHRPLEAIPMGVSAPLKLKCPERNIDDLAYEYLAGGSCPEAFLSSRSVETKSMHLREVLGSHFLESYYLGYSLGLGAGFPFSLDSDPEYVIEQLLEKDLSKSYPTASYTEIEAISNGVHRKRRTRQPMMDHIREQANLIDVFLESHPDFARREVLELSRAYHRLALHDCIAARAALQWVANQGECAEYNRQAEVLTGLLEGRCPGDEQAREAE